MVRSLGASFACRCVTTRAFQVALAPSARREASSPSRFARRTSSHPGVRRIVSFPSRSFFGKGFVLPVHRCGAQLRRHGRTRAAPGAPPAGECRCAGRSRSGSRLGRCDRHAGCGGQLVGEVVRSDETKAEGVLQAGGRLGRVTAFGASSHVRRGGGSEAQPAGWAAAVGRGHGHAGSFPGRPCPHIEADPVDHGVVRP